VIASSVLGGLSEARHGYFAADADALDSMRPWRDSNAVFEA
jgi:hypothetical protein